MIWRWMAVRPRVNGPVARETWCVGLALALLGTGLVMLERHRSDELQERRNREQLGLLEALTSLQRAAVLEVATAWRLSYPEPSEDRLAELRDLVRQLQADPGALDAPAAEAGRTSALCDAQAARRALPAIIPPAAAEERGVMR